MAAELTVLRGRPSHSHLESLRTANDHLRMEVHSLRRERDEDIAAIRPHLRRLELVAMEFGPAAMASVRGIEARLDVMGRRDRRGPRAA